MKDLIIIYSDPNNIHKVLGLGHEVKSIEEWTHQSNTNYLVVGEYSWSIIRESISLGLRGSSFYLATYMNRVGLNDGSNYVFCYEDEVSISEGLEKIHNPDFEKVHPSYKVPEFELITDIDSAVGVFEDLTQLPLGTWFGYDYESKSFPNTDEFILTGLGIATTDRMIFIDYRFCMSTPKDSLIKYNKVNGVWDDEGLQRLSEAHRKFLEKHGRFCVVFNVNFELQATYRYLGDFYEYRDLNVINIMKQYGTWCNLKWTARSILNINSWDDKFEEFNSAFSERDSDLPLVDIDEDGNITRINYDNIRKRFDWITTKDLIEIKQHADVCMNSFYIIPSQHLGYYCGLDCYNTLMSWLVELPNWNYKVSFDNHADLGERIDKLDRFPIEDRFNIMSEAGLDVYCDGKLAESIVNNGGQLVDTEFWRFGLNTCHRYILHAATYLSLYYFEKMLTLYEDRNDLDKYSHIAHELIKEGVDITVGGYYLARELLMNRYYDDSYEGCCNTNKIYEDWGQSVGTEILDLIWYYTDTLEGIGRKRSLFTYVGEIIDRELKLSSDLLEKHDNTINYYYYQSLINTYKSFPWYGVNVDDYKESYVVNGTEMTLLECHNHISCILNINTLQGELWDYVLNDYELDRKFLVLRDSELDWELADYYTGDYEKDKEYCFSDEALSHFSSEYLTKITELLSTDKYEAVLCYKYDHLLLVSDLKWYYPKEYDELISDIRMGNLNTKYKLLWVNVLLRMWAKYFKIKSYFEGLYYEQNDRYDYLDKYWIKNYDVKSEFSMNNNNILAYPEFRANQQFSGRWSSNFHTIPSRCEVKKCTTSPDDSIFTYFDISAMEVRQIGYLARDAKIVELYENKVDLYKFCGKFMLGDEVWNSLTPEEQGEYRSDFKVVLLAYFYLRGARSLAPELGKTVEETQAIMDSLGRTFPEAIEFREYLSNYPLTHEGKLLTVFKEWIVSDEEPYRQVKHGINTVIQGSSAVMLVYGFYNLMKQSWAKGWKFRSVGYVHDSSQSYFDIRHLWEMRDHYYDNVTKFLYDRFRVRFEFDIMAGTNYFEVSKLSQISDDVIQLKGCANSINSIMQRLRRNDIEFELVDSDKFDLTEDGLLKPDVRESLTDFIDSLASEATFRKDHSSYTVQLRKL